jgi:predicted ribosome quality control (RQC) complex YloA/Tae2 family protein
MSIRWDALLARHTARELDALLRDARVRALRLDGAARDLVLLFRDRALLWRLHPTRGHLRMLPPLEPAEGDLAAKARMARVDSLPDDRVLRFALAPSGPSRPQMSLVVELLGNQWNAALTEGDPGRGEPEIVRHVLWRRNGGRAPRVGHPYRPPPSLGRRGVDGDLTVEEWVRLLGALEPGKRAAGLVKAFAWTSPLNARSLLGIGEEAAGDLTAGDGSLEAAHARWRRMADRGAVPDPVVLETEAGPQPYPFPLPGTRHRPADSLLAAIAACAPTEEDDSRAAVEPSPATAPIGPSLMRRLEGASRRAARREERLEAELAALEEPGALRGMGDLILARYREIPPGAASVRLTGFEGEPHDVELDPAEPPHENAARFYARAAKAERARERLPVLLEEARAERTRLEALVTDAREGDLDEEAARELLGPDRPTVRGQVAGPALPYRSYRSSGGLEIRVGRGARHNDDLTFHHSAPDDVWLHARDNAGAHVVLRWPGPGNPPARDLAEAATLAALHSKARTSGSAPVDWTFRKHVRKPRKAAPGRVAADRLQTVFVEPDPGLPARLERLR